MTASAAAALVALELAQVRPSKDNPRKSFAPGPLTELAASIKAQGILEPLLVRRTGKDTYEVMAGERRLKAAKLAGLKTVPCIVREGDSVDAVEEIRLVENLQREDLSLLEKARGYAAYLKGGRKQADLAKALGKTEAHVSQVLAVLALSGPAVELVHNNTLGLKHVRELNRIKDQPAATKTVLGWIRDEAKRGPVGAETVKGMVDEALEEVELERRQKAAQERAKLEAKKTAGRPAAVAKLSTAELKVRAKARLEGMVSRARNKIILERAPKFAEEALLDVKRVNLSDELVELLVGKGVLYPPLAYSHVPAGSRYGVELAGAVLRRLPGKWGNVPPHMVPRPTAAKDARARRSWLALWFWLARRSRGLDGKLDAAARARVKTEAKSKAKKRAPVKKAKR